VIFAETTDEVVEVVKLCGEARVPVIPFGAHLARGPFNAAFGGISLDLSGMNRILAEQDLDCVFSPASTAKP